MLSFATGAGTVSSNLSDTVIISASAPQCNLGSYSVRAIATPAYGITSGNSLNKSNNSTMCL